MGRLFWKFFLFIWLAQMAGVVATGALFWLATLVVDGQEVQSVRLQAALDGSRWDGMATAAIAEANGPVEGVEP